MINKIISVTLMLIAETAFFFVIGFLAALVMRNLGCDIGIIPSALSVTGLTSIIGANVAVIKKFISDKE